MTRCPYCEKPLTYCRCGREQHLKHHFAILKTLTDGMMDEAMQRVDELDPDSSDLEWLFEKHYNLLQLPTELYEGYSNNAAITRTMSDINEMVRQHHADKTLFISDPYKYYGLKKEDFL